MLRQNINPYKEFGNEKKFLRLENSLSPPPPITFLMVLPQLPFLPKIKSSNIFRILPGWLLKQGNQQFQITNDNKTNEKYQFCKVILPDRDYESKRNSKTKN